MGKYSHVIDKLPTLPGVEPERRVVVDEVKAQILAPPRDGEDITLPTDDPVELLDLAKRAIRQLIAIQKRATGGRRWGSTFAFGYAGARDARDKIKELESSLQVLIDAYQELMVDQFVAEGVTSVKLDGGRSVVTFKEPHGKVVNRELYRQYCLADRDLALKMAVPWQSTNALVKQLLLAGEEPPPGIETTARWVVRLGKGDE